MDKNRNYSELSKLKTFKERYDYLKLGDKVGSETFGFERYLNQLLYQSPVWKKTRREVILRDNGCDLGLDGYSIGGKVFIHHMNPIEKLDILNNNEDLFNPEYLICVSFDTHNGIHYGVDFVNPDPIERKPEDTKQW